MPRLVLRLSLVMAVCMVWLLQCVTARAQDLKGVESLRAAIQDLTATFKDRYPKGPEYLARLGQVKTQQEFEALRREALVANPLLSGQPLLVAVREQYPGDHHNTETMFQTDEIAAGKFRGPGALKLVDLTKYDPAQPRLRGRGSPADPPGVTRLVDLPQGVARDPDVNFDGRKVLFSMRRDRKDDYHLYEVNADGTGLRQLTRGAGISDIDPIYLPDDRILFSSTREPKYCMCNRHIMCNLFTMEGDGANIQQIGHSTLHEGHSALMPDGRVIYDRWEYVDRNFGNAQGLWTSNPDGTNHIVYYGNSTMSPGAKLDGRPIPGTDLVICTFSSCHDRPWGALAIIDRRLGTENRPPVVRTWPADAINRVDHGGFDSFGGVHPKYEDPYPLSGKYFLCSRMAGHGGQMAVFLLDTFGNEVLIYQDDLGCFDPMPLAARPRPPIIPSRVDLTKTEGYFFISDVYQGAGMEKIPRGTIKSLRIVSSPEKRFWTGPAWDGGTGQQAPGMAWNDFNNKRVIGTVPVESDGSAFFSVPADTFVYFQLLDERGMMVQSMRSGTIARPGERTGCVGCHENRQSSVPMNTQSLAMRRGPSTPQPWHGAGRNYNYVTDAQPAFDRHCVSCHDYGKEAGKKLNLAGDLNVCFNTSYVELRSKGLVNVVGAGPAQVLPPKSWGSHASRLTEVLLKGHGKPEIDQKVKLDAESFDRIVTWIDINAPYYPEYAGGAYRNNQFGRSPLDGGQLGRLQHLTGTHFGHGNMIQVSFTRPEISPCLTKFADKNNANYKAALALIQAGKDNLTKNPRPDMPGFRLTDKEEIAQQCKYDALRRANAAAKAATAAGKKYFEKVGGE